MPAAQLGLQVHCLRFEIGLQGLESSLARLAPYGFQALEMVSFPGCRGNRWGDFGMATDLEPERIAEILRTTGIKCPSTHVTPNELSPSNIGSTLKSARVIGIETIVLNSLPRPTSDGPMAQLAAIADLNVLGARLRAEEFKLVLHMQPELWRLRDGVRVADQLPTMLEPSFCRLEFDPSGPIAYGTDPAEYVATHAGKFFAIHLRDGLAPLTPASHLPALPLGAGCVNWEALLGAAAGSDIAYYFLEMEVANPADTHSAIETSLRFLRAHGYST